MQHRVSVGLFESMTFSALESSEQTITRSAKSITEKGNKWFAFKCCHLLILSCICYSHVSSTMADKATPPTLGNVIHHQGSFEHNYLINNFSYYNKMVQLGSVVFLPFVSLSINQENRVSEFLPTFTQVYHPINLQSNRHLILLVSHSEVSASRRLTQRQFEVGMVKSVHVYVIGAQAKNVRDFGSSFHVKHAHMHIKGQNRYSQVPECFGHVEHDQELFSDCQIEHTQVLYCLLQFEHAQMLYCLFHFEHAHMLYCLSA